MSRRLVLVLALLATPVLAQTYEPPRAGDPGAASDDPFQQGLEQFMQNLLDRAQPSLDRLGQDLGGLAQRMGPVLGELGDLMDDVRNYQAPERLENGDILIRRRADAPPPPEIGPNLRDMMRPAPERAPGQAPADPPADLREAPGGDIEL
ncbi:hypothetical protein GL279_04120 [Paracoccus limosus]|jgi:hypothetical protein|uniref:AAA+ family ATPase n=1 Tax=Paracoccus limosus TaxID=913252 RepID=A0A844H5K5_9RHOB|nr:hypothetical protein [Paracoccus limosus]MTH33777.1 hypothetical protein [Paracoccus limosus]